jgi:hypothetical protein
MEAEPAPLGRNAVHRDAGAPELAHQRRPIGESTPSRMMGGPAIID